MSKSIKVLGTGCAKCKTLATLINEVVAENSIDATVEKVEDLLEIMEYNVMTTPALIVDGELKAKGRVPSKSEITKMLND